MSESAATPTLVELGAPAPPSPAVVRRLDAQRERLAETLQSGVRRPLRRRCDVQFGPYRTMRAAELGRTLPTGAWSASEGEGQHRLLIGVSRSLQQSVVDRILGGPGECEEGGRPPSPLERELGGDFHLGLHAALAESLAAPPLLLRTLDPRLLEEPPETYLDDPHQAFVVLEAEVGTEHSVHSLRLAMSVEGLEQDDDGPPPAPERSAVAQAALKAREVCLDVEWARCRLSLDELSDLRVGDVVLFEAVPGEDVDLCLEGRSLARARLGRSQGRHAVEVLELDERGTQELTHGQA